MANVKFELAGAKSEWAGTKSKWAEANIEQASQKASGSVLKESEWACKDGMKNW